MNAPDSLRYIGRSRRLGSWLVSVLLVSAAAAGVAQKPAARLHAEITNADRVQMPNSRAVKAKLGADAGEVPSSLPLTGVHLEFSRTAAQEADLQALLAAQQNPASPLYHQWLTPEQFGARFGVADSDLEKAEQWLASEGLTVDSVSRSRNSIEFSGSAGAMAQAFGAPLHYYTGSGERNVAPSSDITLPASLASMTSSVRGLDNYRLRPSVKRRNAEALQPALTSSQTGNHFLTPGDLATIYDLKPLYNSGYDGTGQTIAVMGQSAVVTSDITAFQTAAGLTVKNPTMLLVPGTGTSTLYTGDESESDLDLEYASGLAPGAQVIFVYTGNSNNNGVVDALYYAINDRVAPVLSFSYAGCEPYSGSITSFEAKLAQAAAQGQTVVAASGDEGAEACYGGTGLTAAQQQQVSVNYPASSAYVLGMGGTQTAASALTTSLTGTAYWSGASNGTDTISSALQYLPEVAWNETAANGSPSASGGGVSTLVARPSWQTGVAGIPTGNFRLVPDIALQSSIFTPGYVYCSSDTTATGITGSCSNGFRDSNNKNFTVAGGTSFATPIFAGMLAILNQATHSTGQGLINPTLYTLASNATTYASAFHDVTSGNTFCPVATTGCGTAASTVYAAGTGYDEATGLGSIDLNNLYQAWPKAAAAALQASTVTLTPATASPAVSASDVITIKVAPGSSLTTTVPTGTVSIVLDGGTATSATLSAGVASYTFAGTTTTGAHTIVVTYSGDGTFAASNATTVLNVGSGTAVGSFTLSGAGISVTAGSSGSSTISVTPTGGYLGTVGFSVSTTSANLVNACYKINNVSVTSTSPATTTLTIGTNATTCASFAKVGTGQVKPILSTRTAQNRVPAIPGSRHPVSLALAALGFGVIGWRKRRSVRIRTLMSFGLLAVLAVGASGCGSSSSANSGGGSSSGNAPTGSYAIVVTGTDTTTSSITGTTSLTLTIN